MGILVLRDCREKEESEVPKAHRGHLECLVKRSVCLNISLLFHKLRERVKCGVIFNKEYLKINLRGNAFQKESLYQQAKMDLCFLNVHDILCP